MPEPQATECSSVTSAVHTTLTHCTADRLAKGVAGITTDVFDALLPDRRSRAWNSAKVTAHHAIIPTSGSKKHLKPDELKVYALVCRNYLAQFLPDHVFFETKVVIEIEGGQFRTHQRQPSVSGWKRLFGQSVTSGSSADNQPEKKTSADTRPTHKTGNTDTNDSSLPSAESQLLPKDLVKGQTVTCRDCTITDKQTQPPKHFTDGTLLTAMTGIARYVSDQTLIKSLSDTDGLGTEATRAGMIELLIRRDYITREHRDLRATATGIAFIEALPDVITLPDRTAQWESLLTAIRERRANYDALMQPLIHELHRLVEDSRNMSPAALAGLRTGQPDHATRTKPAFKKRGKRRFSRSGDNASPSSAPFAKKAAGKKATRKKTVGKKTPGKSASGSRQRNTGRGVAKGSDHTPDSTDTHRFSQTRRGTSR